MNIDEFLTLVSCLLAGRLPLDKQRPGFVAAPLETTFISAPWKWAEVILSNRSSNHSAPEDPPIY
jgi:hypothetical protein